jgi:hypothetical protein
MANRCLCQKFPTYFENQCLCSVHSLSPSDEAVTAAQIDIAGLLPREKEPKRRLKAITPNHSAVVLWIAIGEIRVLLGSDLEERSGGGWSLIVHSTSRPVGKALFFKIPHHGSENAHHPKVWENMLIRDAVAVLTPFESGSIKLPSEKDVRRICSETTQSYSTASRGSKRKKRNRAVEKTIRETVRSIKQIHSSIGHVRFRIKSPEECRIELFGNAKPLGRFHTSM